MSDSYLAAVASRTASTHPLNPMVGLRNDVQPKPLSPAAPSRPLRHIVTFNCADWSQAKADTLDNALGMLPMIIPQLSEFHYGPDMGMREPGYNMHYAITADFPHEEAYKAFCRHPAYAKVVNEVIKPMLAPGEHVARVQFKINHTTRSKQSLMQADPPLFNVRFGKSARAAAADPREANPASPTSVQAL